ncbi:paraquat-inducible protein A [Rhodovibrionaceae bacterium A322]
MAERKTSLSLFESFFTFRKARESLSTRARGWHRLIPWVFLASGLSLLAGITVPLFRIQSFYVLEDEISVVGSIYLLMQDGEVFIALVIALFSIVTPLTKLLASDYVWRARALEARAIQNTIKTIDLLGKWSMLDVFIVAFIVFSVKTSIFANIQTETGIYFFCASVLGSMVGALLLKNAIAQASLPPASDGPQNS